MRIFASGLLVISIAACSHKSLPPKPPNPPPPPSTAPETVQVGRRPDDPIPRVVRRILAEEKELVNRSLEMAATLPDPRGRARATAEALALASELDAIGRPIEALTHDTGTTSETLDDAVAKLLLIDTRVALLHESLRTATNHTTAVVAE